MIYSILYSIIIILFIILITIRCNNQENMLAYNKINKDEYKIYHYDKNCELRCGDQHNCMRLKYRTDNYLKSKKCNENKKYVYHDIVNYSCLDKKDKYKNEIQVNYDTGLGCPNYNNISSTKMIKPYYIMKKSLKNLDKYNYNNYEIIDKCEFCWNLN